MRGRRWVFLAVTLALGACTSDRPSFRDGDPTGGGEVTPALAERTVLGLCGSAGLLGTDPEGASAAFLDRAHEGLHAIARELQEVDREAAGAVLEAKAVVEAGFASGAPTPEEMATLLTATRDGLSVLGIASPPCPS